ncbi:ABC transporter substrate-binding protein [Desulfocurvibacter africanus]|uniref:ABC transporter substrate-binding protein n=1 Tax=Desulfocurvibacter africanus TaxID=873 RepID=UPI002FD8F4E0
MRKLLTLACSLAALLLVACGEAPQEKKAEEAAPAAPAQAEAKSYINGIDANFPPFAFVDESGKPSGFDVDSVNWIAEKMGFKVTHQPIDWDGIIPALLSNKIDFIASGMSITEERAQKVNFSMPYWIIKQVFVTKADAALSLDDMLKGKKTLGVQRGTSEAEWLKEKAAAEGWNFELRYYDSAPLAVEDVVNGRIDAAAMDDAPAKDATAKKPVKILGTFGMKEEEFGYATRKEDAELLAKLNEGLKLLMADPYWEELQVKYGLK